MRAKRAAYISATLLLQTIVVTVASLILLRLILSHFGSDYNGVVGSINQFIGFTSLLTAGVGGATLAALFKPLSDGDMAKISGTVRARRRASCDVSRLFLSGFLLVVNTITSLTSTFAGGSMTSGFGDMLAKGEVETLKDGVRVYEFACNTLAVFGFLCGVWWCQGLRLW